MLTRSFRAMLALALATIGVAVPAAPIAAQVSFDVDLALVRQDPAWTNNRGRHDLMIQVVATNRDLLPLDDLRLVAQLGNPYVSRAAYEASISGGVSSVMSSRSAPFDGTLDPGTARTFGIELDMREMEGVLDDDSKVYPLTIQLRSGGEVAGELTSAAIHLVRRPEQPLRLSWWFEVSASSAFGPDGRLVNTSLEAAIAPGGTLAAPIAAIGAVAAAGEPVNLVVRPSLLEDLRAIADGYQRADGSEVAAAEGAAPAAASILEQLRVAANGAAAQVTAMPLDAPSVPAMLGSGLTTDLLRHEARAVTVVEQTLGVTPVVDAARPPGGALDDATLAHYAEEGVTTVLADADTVERPAGDNGKAPLPSAPVIASSGAPVDLILPDPGTQALMERVDLLEDPLRASQLILGELAMIWKEEPVPPDEGVRGIALAPPPDLPPRIWSIVLPLLTETPFLRDVHPQVLRRVVDPRGEPTTLLDPATDRFSEDYAARIRALHIDVDAYASMLVEPGDIPEGLHRDLLRAESDPYLGAAGEAAGIADWIDPVGARTSEAFASTTPQVQQIFTFTGREGTIPLRMGDPGEDRLRVEVAVQSSQFDFPDGSEQEVVLERPNQLVEFEVSARASGAYPIIVIVRTPVGREISSQPISVRTSGVNSFALLITGGAGVGLLLLYARRRLRRRR